MINDSWRKALLVNNATLQQAIHCINESSLQIAVIVAPNGKLLGTVTDGDIRRGLLRGLQLNGPIDDVINRDPMVVPPEWGRDIVLQLMQANKIHQLPVVDENRQVVNIHLWGDLLSPEGRPNVMVIMAGGRGTRLGPHTDNCPKPLLPVGDKPMLEHIVERAKAEGFTKFIFAIHYLGNMIEDYFGDGSAWQVEIDYLHEKSPLGTAGALGLIESRPDIPFLVTNGDVLTDIRYGELVDFHCYHRATGTMAVRQHEWQHPFGVVKTQGVDITGFEEKPVARSHINAGVYVLEPSALDALSGEQHCDMPTLFTRLKSQNQRTIVYPMHEPWLDVGRPDDLAQARDQYSY